MNYKSDSTWGLVLGALILWGGLIMGAMILFMVVVG
jgi:hypothetical protein